ncbi:hypothetical protein [Luteimonas sp. SDU101]|uniref:hypothetical protein n=1 Tax=Luteimonas sp. SDU101 TaxID=3422593 RepID=UPI003EBE2C1A
MKKHLPLLGLAMATAFAFNANASSATGQLTASVPGSCTIVSTDSAHAEFTEGLSGQNKYGYFMVSCNRDMPYTVASSADASGRIVLTATSGTPGAEMIVELRDGTDTAWLGNGDYVVYGTGTGSIEMLNIGFSFNPDGGIPPVGFYEGQYTITLTATGF